MGRGCCVHAAWKLANTCSPDCVQASILSRVLCSIEPLGRCVDVDYYVAVTRVPDC
jgi:hypothetical protein